MELTIHVPDEVPAAAKARGVGPEAYVEEIVNERIAAQSKDPIQSAQQIRSWLDSLTQFSDKIPPLPKIISREWIYQDHE